jgi:hypothetical protein
MYDKTSERSEQGYIFAPGELGERRFRREAQWVRAASGSANGRTGMCALGFPAEPEA